MIRVQFCRAKLNRATRSTALLLLLTNVCYWQQRSPRLTDVQAKRTRPTVTFARIGEEGRLGNQMFQLAATIGLARKHKYDWDFFPNVRKSSVGQLFRISGKLVPGKDHIDMHYSEQSELYYDVILPKGDHTSVVSLSGYFQDYRYFVAYLDVLDNYLKLPQSMIDYIQKRVPEVNSPFTVALHVRRGDYVKLHDLYNLLDEGYYTRALALVKGKIDAVVVISDDLAWCKKYLAPKIPYKVVYSPFRDELSDFLLLHLSKTLIISSSSFSWWAAFLKHVRSRSLDDTARIFAPDTWYNVSGRFAYMNRDSFLPPAWVRVSA